MAHKWWEYFFLVVISLLRESSKTSDAWWSRGNLAGIFIYVSASSYIPDKARWEAADFHIFCLLRCGLIPRLDYPDHIKPAQQDFNVKILIDCHVAEVKKAAISSHTVWR